MARAVELGVSNGVRFIVRELRGLRHVDAAADAATAVLKTPRLPKNLRREIRDIHFSLLHIVCAAALLSHPDSARRVARLQSSRHITRRSNAQAETPDLSI